MKVFITKVIPEQGLEVLRTAGVSITQFSEKRELSTEEIIDACIKHDALLSAGKNIIDEAFLEKCGHLKGISLLSVGYDNVDIPAATKHKIPVSNTPGVLSGATSDIALLLMLSVSRKAFYWHSIIGKGEWDFFEPTAGLGVEITGKTLGIFGMGQIGSALARKCKSAYGMKIIYHNRSRNAEAEKELDATYVSWHELLEQSDILSVHANLSSETQGLFNMDAFTKMKPSGIFINTARGAIHNEGHLIEALEKGMIWGAGLDVTNPEPMAKDNPLLDMPTVCVLPHIGSATLETRSVMSVIAARNIVAALQGKQMPQVINPEAYR
ncbi:D-glycerate dehydrogenase [Danxiaibacter flavus]|uniref:D-glycerate dehydrogenase n=1 Tax=Danxiaibacter flavus TaxID=3049108 RepID=A0ABV3ZEI4_9BACT|nr:D-glycerate dehydrogenase [Chitinophagaceae bacterium DXS]